ncbi:MAG: hypothetical protein HYZ75_17245 [Elusimicrobia bacterium]|nr:hypothetical protein [Elusimicrobiota bacterium]
MWVIKMAAALALASYAADTGPGRFLKKGDGVVLVADLASGGRFTESRGGGAGAAPPASLFKIADALALARAGRPAAVYCRGGCSRRPGHGAVSLRAAFAHSCNNFFRERLVERETLLAAGLELGLARAEALPALRRAPAGELALGLSPGLALTPEELLEAAALWPAGPAWPILRPLLSACVAEGTCAPARLPGMTVAGKTGTAPAPDGSGATSGWFVGFAPAEAPRAVVVVFLDRGQGRDAAAAAGEVLAWWFRSSSSPL